MLSHQSEFLLALYAARCRQYKSLRHLKLHQHQPRLHQLNSRQAILAFDLKPLLHFADIFLTLPGYGLTPLPDRPKHMTVSPQWENQFFLKQELPLQYF